MAKLKLEANTNDGYEGATKLKSNALLAFQGAFYLDADSVGIKPCVDPVQRLSRSYAKGEHFQAVLRDVQSPLQRPNESVESSAQRLRMRYTRSGRVYLQEERIATLLERLAPSVAIYVSLVKDSCVRNDSRLLAMSLTW